jgi:hypothetical protein
VGIELSMWQITTLQLEQLMSSEDAMENFIDSRFAETANEDDDEGLYLDKIWHLLHYLITGDAEGGEYPLGHAILGGYMLHESGEDTSFLPPEIVKDVAEGLSTLTEADMRKLCDQDITPKPEIYKYPFPIDEEDFEDALSFFRQVRELYKDAAEKGNAMFRFFH